MNSRLVARRLRIERQKWIKEQSGYPLIREIQSNENDESIVWTVYIKGVPDTPFEHGVYALKMYFNEYPLKRPVIVCTAPLFADIEDTQNCGHCHPWTPTMFCVEFIARLWQHCCTRPHHSLQSLISFQPAVYIAVATRMNHIYANGPFYAYPQISTQRFQAITQMIPYFVHSMCIRPPRFINSVPTEIIELIRLYYGSKQQHCFGWSHIKIGCREKQSLWPCNITNTTRFESAVSKLMDAWIQNKRNALANMIETKADIETGQTPIEIRLKHGSIRDGGHGVVVKAFLTDSIYRLKQRIFEQKVVDGLQSVEQIQSLYAADADRFRYGAHLASFQYNDWLQDTDTVNDIPRQKYDLSYRDKHGRIMMYYHIAACLCSASRRVICYKYKQDDGNI